MTPEHASAFELIRSVHALDSSVSSVRVGDVVVRFNRAAIVPVASFEPSRRDAELEAEVAVLRMKLSQADPEGVY